MFTTKDVKASWAEVRPFRRTVKALREARRAEAFGVAVEERRERMFFRVDTCFFFLSLLFFFPLWWG